VIKWRRSFARLIRVTATASLIGRLSIKAMSLVPFLDDLSEAEFEQVLALDEAGDQAAARFMRWLCHEVMPATARGGYRERTPGEAAGEIARVLAGCEHNSLGAGTKAVLAEPEPGGAVTGEPAAVSIVACRAADRCACGPPPTPPPLSVRR
jgi:hypothetical protein